MIIWREGDLFAAGLHAIAHGVNCRGVMGAGIAAQFRQRWPQMYESYRKRCLKGELLPGEIQPWKDAQGTVIFNLATQREPGPGAQPWMITAAAGQMITEAHHDYKITEIGLPMIGCGIGGLAPDQLRAALLPYADAPVNLIVFSYAPPGQPAVFTETAHVPPCDGLDGEPCTSRAAWLLTYECVTGHVTYRKYCALHDGRQPADQYAARTCGAENGRCAGQAWLVSRIRPQR